MAGRFQDTEDEAIVAEINITPLTDIFLVLLIIFMISSSIIMESGLPVKLPSAKTTTVNPSKSGKPIYITVGKDGAVLINQKAARDESLAQSIREALAASDDKTVVIRGDESIVLGKAVKIMDAARTAGAEKIAIATQNEK